MLQPILLMLPWLGMVLRSHGPAIRRRRPAPLPAVMERRP